MRTNWKRINERMKVKKKLKNKINRDQGIKKKKKEGGYQSVKEKIERNLNKKKMGRKNKKDGKKVEERNKKKSEK